MAIITYNRKIAHDFEILEKIEAGIALIGSEVKSIKAGQINIEGGYVNLRSAEAYLVGAHVAPWKFKSDAAYDPYRSRKLLLNKKELNYLIGKAAIKGLTIKPISVYTTKRGLIKLEIAVLRGKKQFDKRETIRKRELERETSRKIKIDNKRSLKL